MATVTHGTAYRYDEGCRCDECRTAKVTKRREARDRARAAGSASYHRELAKSRDLKRQRRGTCSDCGGETRYNGKTVNGPSERCLACTLAKQKAERKWTRETVIDAIRRFAAENGRPPSSKEWIRANPEKGYPAASTVFSHKGRYTPPFDYWSDAIEAAGFPRSRRGRPRKVAA